MNKVMSLLLCILACGSVMAEGNPTAGKSKSLICSGCHTHDGNSKNPKYPVLAEQGQAYMIKQLLDFKSGARKESHMTPIVEAITLADVPDLAAYFSAQKRSPNAAAPPTATTGQQIFLNGKSDHTVESCSGCHGDDAKGNAALKFPSLAGQHADYIAKTLKEFRSGTRNNDQNALMREIAKGLNDQEIEALAAYVGSLR